MKLLKTSDELISHMKIKGIKFDIAKEEEDTVLFCVKNHNKIQIESTNVTDCIKQAKLIRDADKIDILNAYTDLNAYQITNKLNEISETVEKQFFLKKMFERHIILCFK